MSNPTLTPYEDLMNDSIVAYLNKRCHRYGWQVPVLDGRIDFVGIRDSYEVIAIESKTSNWRKGLRQAQAYLLCSDKSYVALPAQIASSVVQHRNSFQKRRVGLIAVGKNVEIVIRGRRSNLLIPELRNYVLKLTLHRNRNSRERVSARICQWLDSKEDEMWDRDVPRDMEVNLHV